MIEGTLNGTSGLVEAPRRYLACLHSFWNAAGQADRSRQVYPELFFFKKCCTTVVLVLVR